MPEPTPDLSVVLPTETVLEGPFHLFNNSFTIEYLRPDPSRNASVLMRARYNMSHPETKLGKKYAQVPPLHLHFTQAESFVVLQGKVGTTTTYDMVDNVWTRENTRTPITVPPWTPHTFWPVVSEGPAAGGGAASSTADEEDAILLVWAHPTNPARDFVYPPLLDHLFFISLFGHVNNVHEGKEKLDILWVMYSQHETQTTNVMLPTWKFLGPLRWAIPYGLQAVLATIGRWQGKPLLLEKYVGSENYKDWQVAEGKLKRS